MNKKHKKVCKVLNHIEHSLIVISTITKNFFVSSFASLVENPIGITSSVIGINICVIITQIKNYKSINNKNKKKHDQIVLLAKSKLTSIEVLICKALIDSNISYDKFFLINNVLKTFYDTKEEIRNSNGK